MLKFVSVYWDTLELNIWRIRIRIVKKCCRCNFVTWKLIFLVSWIVMLWYQCSKYLNLFRNRVSLHDVIIFYYGLFFLLFGIESLIQIRMICTHVIIPFIKTPVIVSFVKTPSIMNPWIISGTYLCRFWSFRSDLRFRVFKTWKISFRCFTLKRVFRIFDSFGLSSGFFLFSWLLPLPSLLDHDLLGLSLSKKILVCIVTCVAVSLQRCSRALKTLITRTRWSFSFARRERIDRINIHGIWVSTLTRVTRHGITNFQTKLRLHVRHDFQTRILESSQAIWLEYQMPLKLLRHQCFQISKLDFIV